MLWTSVSSRNRQNIKGYVPLLAARSRISFAYLGRVPHSAETCLDIQMCIDLSTVSCIYIRVSHWKHQYLGCAPPTFDSSWRLFSPQAVYMNCRPGGIWRVCWLGRVRGGEWDNWVRDKLVRTSISNFLISYLLWNEGTDFKLLQFHFSLFWIDI